MSFLASYFDSFLNYLVFLVDKAGYTGIFICMFLESTFVPIPSEVIMLPAGISAAYGKINLHLAIAVGVIGNLFGALFNYYLAVYFGRQILFKVSKYCFVKEKNILQVEAYFKKHGEVSTFVGRLIPGVRHFISLPAGVSRMNLKSFCIYTFAGSAIWVTVLTYLGFFIGENKNLIREYLDLLIILCLALCCLIVLIYVLIQRKMAKIKA